MQNDRISQLSLSYPELRLYSSEYQASFGLNRAMIGTDLALDHEGLARMRGKQNDEVFEAPHPVDCNSLVSLDLYLFVIG